MVEGSREGAKAQREESMDPFARFLCIKCGEAGIDSWNKGIYDGIDWGDDLPDNPHIIGENCANCNWPVVVSYYGPDHPVHAIFGPVNKARGGCSVYDYEAGAFATFQAYVIAGVALEPSSIRDDDWSGGCMALASPPPLRVAGGRGGTATPGPVLPKSAF